MQPERFYVFPPFRLDLVNECLWCDERPISLRSKPFAVLRCLLEHAGQLVTKDVLFQTVWPGVYVSDSPLMVCIHELRKALGDEAHTPRFIETVHGRGYRFLPAVTTPPVPSSKFQVPSSDTQHSVLSTRHSVLVGREAELAQLHGWSEKALNGERQLVFVSGEAGIGKTSVVEAFLSSLESSVQRPEENQKAKIKRQKSKGKNQKAKIEAPTPNTQYPTPGVWLGWGQCIEHYGAGEGYMPVLEALGRLCREPEGGRLIEFLSQHAPTWLAQMPALLSAAEREKLQREVAGATRERMLREMAEALEALTREQPLVLQLEDLHWSDVSTLELLSVLARRHEVARLLVLGTYRPVEMLANGHPLRTVRQELQVHRQCEEQRLAFLTEEHVAEYLAARLAIGPTGRSPVQNLARLVHQRTEGNPLFMVNVVEYLTAQGGLEESIEKIQIGIPGDLRQMIEEQIHRLGSAERRVLEVASVAGVEFSAAAVAAGLGVAVEEVEEQCEALVRREQFLRVREPAEWPDGTVAARYQFLHALYQEVVYERIPAARRSQLHRVIGGRIEAAYGAQAKEVAAELAVHFERGRDYLRAIQYLQQAGENAVRRSAHQEAITLLTKGIELLKTLPDTPERAQQDLALQVTLGTPLMVTKGYSASELGAAYSRARELCQQMGETPQLFSVLWGLWSFYHGRAEFQTSHGLGEQLLRLAENLQDPALLVEAHFAWGDTLVCLGEFASARACLEQGIAFYNPQRHYSLAFLYGFDPGVVCRSFAAWTLWLLGYPEQALKRGQEALTLAQELPHLYSLVIALGWTSFLHQYRLEGRATQERAESTITLSAEQGFPFWLAAGTILQGWALAEQGQGEEGITQIRQGLSVHQATGSELWRPYFLSLLAEVYGKGGQAEEGLSVLAEALAVVDKTGERVYEAELYRLKGELLLAQEGFRPQAVGHREKTEEAEACFLKAIDIARKQQAKSLELRAVMSLARLWQKQGKKKQARKLLAQIYGWFTEGFDTKDLQEARALLRELS